jgi:hypothetical protein
MRPQRRRIQDFVFKTRGREEFCWLYDSKFNRIEDISTSRLTEIQDSAFKRLDDLRTPHL